jgi:hypothetical protein
MAQSRGAAGREACDVDAEIREPEQVSERPLAASGNARGERRGWLVRNGRGGASAARRATGRLAFSDTG